MVYSWQRGLSAVCVCVCAHVWYSNELHVVCEQLQPSTAAQKPTGKVVGIIKRNWRPFCGMLSVSQIKEVRVSCLQTSLDTAGSFSALKPIMSCPMLWISFRCVPCTLRADLVFALLSSQPDTFSPPQNAVYHEYASRPARHQRWPVRGSWWPSMAGPNIPDTQM